MSSDSILTITEKIAATWETALDIANALFLVTRRGRQCAFTHPTGILDSPAACHQCITRQHVSTAAVPAFLSIDDILTVVPAEETVRTALRAPQTEVSRDGWTLNEDKIQGLASQGTSLGDTWATTKDKLLAFFSKYKRPYTNLYIEGTILHI